MKFTVLLLFLITLVSSGAPSKRTILTEMNKPVVVPAEKTRRFQFHQTQQRKRTILLRIKTRMDTRSTQEASYSSMHHMRIIVNGKAIKPNASRTVSRLLNKPLVSPVGPRLKYPWCQEEQWNVLHMPDFKAAYKLKAYVDDPYLYVFDITDLSNPVAENIIIVENTTRNSYVSKHGIPDGKGGKKFDLHIGSLIVDEYDKSSPTMQSNEVATKIINRGKAVAKPAEYDGKISSGGGIILNIGKNVYRFQSKFSYPHLGFNYLHPEEAKNNANWKISVNKNKVTVVSPLYKIVRSVNFGSRRIEIRDSISNLNKLKPLGLSVRNELLLDGKLKSAPTRLAGSPDPARNDYHAIMNPSVHLHVPEGGLAFVAEDHVYRCQSLLYSRPEKSVAGIRTDMLRLAPGETYTIKWAIYPVSSPDYYDFINIARIDWKANFTALGPWRWGTHAVRNLNTDQMAPIFDSQKIKYFITTSWAENKWHSPANKDGIFRIAFGNDVLSPYWKYRRDAVAEIENNIRTASPDTKIFWYYDIVRESADDALMRFKDAVFLNERQQPSVSSWKPANNSCYRMVANMNNSFGKAVVETARRYLDNHNLDGIYWDEALGNIQFNHIPKSYNPSTYDGHSCILNTKSWTIKQEVGIPSLAVISVQNAVAELTSKRNKILFTNGSLIDTDARYNYKTQGMIEIQHNSFYAFEGNLSTPLGYMSWDSSWDDFLRALNMATLPANCLETELKHDISPFMFPFTTIAIYPGFMMAQERIIATHSGTYGWHGSRALAQVRHFDKHGRLSDKDYVSTINDEAMVKVILQAKEALVLEKIPVEFMPAGNKTAKISSIKYSKNKISMRINSSDGGKLKLTSALFSLASGVELDITLGQRTLEKSPDNESLSIDIPADFSDTVIISRKIK